MRLVVELQLQPTDEQRSLLLATMRAFNAAATHAARMGFDRQVFNRFGLSRLTYHEMRKRFGIKALHAVTAFGKVADAFTRDTTKCPAFRPLAALVLEKKSLRYYADSVSILTLTGRQCMPCVCSERQRAMLTFQKGQSDLVYRAGRFYLLACVEIAEAAPLKVGDYLGVDMGLANLASTSDGQHFAGTGVDAVRLRYFLRRQRLQRKTARHRKRRTRRNARRALRGGGNREALFRRDVNHCISKQIVRAAKDTKRGIAVEDLTYIRARIRLQKAQRARHHGWGFAQLRGYIEYKARLAGVPVVTIDPAYTSQTCSACGCCEKANRPSQSEFRCLACGFATHADSNAAQNIRAKALASAPHVTEPQQPIAA
jgi:putative transposase